MGARVSAETKLAIHLHKTQQKSMAEAAKIAGVHITTLYRALEREKGPRKHKRY